MEEFSRPKMWTKNSYREKIQGGGQTDEWAGRDDAVSCSGSTLQTGGIPSLKTTENKRIGLHKPPGGKLIFL